MCRSSRHPSRHSGSADPSGPRHDPLAGGDHHPADRQRGPGRCPERAGAATDGRGGGSPDCAERPTTGHQRAPHRRAVRTGVPAGMAWRNRRFTAGNSGLPPRVGAVRLRGGAAAGADPAADCARPDVAVGSRRTGAFRRGSLRAAAGGRHHRGSGGHHEDADLWTGSRPGRDRPRLGSDGRPGTGPGAPWCPRRASAWVGECSPTGPSGAADDGERPCDGRPDRPGRPRDVSPC